MPIYTCTTPEGTLSATQRAFVAAEITRIHAAHTGAPPSFVRAVFQTLTPDSFFTAGKSPKNFLLVGIIRTGRSTEVKARMLNDLWSMYKKATGAQDDQINITLMDVPGSNAMEFGGVLPEAGNEKEWFASRGPSDRWSG